MDALAVEQGEGQDHIHMLVVEVGHQELPTAAHEYIWADMGAMG